MDRYGKELELLLLLTDNASHTALQIADKLRITRRSVYYYFDYLTDCGFKLIKKGTTYRLDTNTLFFKKIATNVSFSDDEAMMLYRVLDSADNNNIVAQALKTKIVRFYNLDMQLSKAVMKLANRNAQLLRDAISMRKVVNIKGYSSPHSKTLSDRMVEPFLMMNDDMDVRCYEFRSSMNKTFKVTRMKEVEILDVDWMHEDMHKPTYTDLFMFSGETRTHIKLLLGQLSHNLLLEEYPHSADSITEADDTHWYFETDVVSNLGIGRFILGLYDDIRIIEGDDLREYINKKLSGFAESCCTPSDSH